MKKKKHSKFVKECEFDMASDLIMITLSFPHASFKEGQTFHCAIGIEEAKELRKALQNAIFNAGAV